MAEMGNSGGLSEELRNNLLIGLGTGLIGGGLLGFLATAATLALNPYLLASFADTVRLLLGLQTVYAVICLVIGLLVGAAKTLLFVLSGRRLSDTKTAAVLSGAVFFLMAAAYATSWCRWNEIGGLSPDRPLRPDQAPVLLIIAAVSLLLARMLSYAFYLILVHVKKPDRRRPGDLRKAFFTILYMGGAFALFVIIMRIVSEPPRQAGLTQDMFNPHGRSVLLLGIEGMTLQDTARLRSEGYLDWSELLLEGTVGPVSVPGNASPPMAWTMVATGRDLAAHGIVDVQTQVIRGLSASIRVAPEQIGLYNIFQTVVPFMRLTRTVPVKSYMRATKGLWNIASDADFRSATVNWWVSWPAERVRGDIVSDHAWLKLKGPVTGVGDPQRDADGEVALTRPRVGAGVQIRGNGMTGAVVPIRPDGNPLLLESETWPKTLLIELSALAWESIPDSLADRYGAAAPEDALASLEGLGIPRDVLLSDLFYAQSAAWLLDRREPRLWILHLPGPDILRRVLGRDIADPAAREEARREALRVYWRTLDPALRSVFRRIAAPPQEAPGHAAFWVCLPGAAWDNAAAVSQDGFIALAGRGVARTRLDTPIRLTEIAPTVLWILGLPVALDMDGGPRTGLLSAEAASPLLPIRTVATYGRQEVPDLSRAAGSLDQEMLERFRSLGYIN